MIFKTHKNISIQIDSEDFEKVNAYRWHQSRSGHMYCSTKQFKTLFIHTLIMGYKPSKYVVCDHINQNPLDNRKKNLRITNRRINSLNKGKSNYSYEPHSKYKGVSLTKKPGVYRAYTSFYSKQKIIGTYDNELEAAKAYNLYILKYVGSDIALNDIDNDYLTYIPFPKISFWNCDFNRNIFKHGKKFRLKYSIDNELVTSLTCDYQSVVQIRFILYMLILNNYSPPIREHT